MAERVPTFDYDLQELPPGRWPFRRWRWELFDGGLMLAAGWTTAPAAAERMLVRAASRRLHELQGVRALRPEAARLLDPLRSAGGARVETGVGSCLLVRLPAEPGARRDVRAA